MMLIDMYYVSPRLLLLVAWHFSTQYPIALGIYVPTLRKYFFEGLYKISLGHGMDGNVSSM